MGKLSFRKLREHFGNLVRVRTEKSSFMSSLYLIDSVVSPPVTSYKSSKSSALLL